MGDSIQNMFDAHWGIIDWSRFMSWDEVSQLVDQNKRVFNGVEEVNVLDLQSDGNGRFPYLDLDIDDMYFGILRSPIIPVKELAQHILWNGDQVVAYIARQKALQ